MKRSLKIIVIVFLTIATATMMQSCEKKPAPPVLTTSVVSGITLTSAVSGGNVTKDGNAEITVRGIAWSTTENPTTSSDKTINGTGSGSFTAILTGLTANTTYYVRAYATNSEGTSYGNQLSFKTSSVQGEGNQKSDLPGGTRSGAASFSIGTKVYIGLGGSGDLLTMRDFWEWDQATNVWVKKADYPGNSTRGAIGFSIGTKGYIGTGSTSTGAVTSEFWEYDPATNTWTEKASLPLSAARAYATGFSIGTKGYIGTGFVTDDLAAAIGINYRQDFWEWDQETNTWTEKAFLPGNSFRSSATGFSIGTKGYIGTGFVTDGVGSSELFQDLWEWDQETDTWTEKANFGESGRAGAVGFSIGNKGYIGIGSGQGFLIKDVWEWDQATNIWTRKADFEGYARSSAVGVSIGNKGYIGTGLGAINNTLQDFWEYDPKQ